MAETGSIEETAKVAGMTPTEVSAILSAGKNKLWDFRLNVRPKPHRDEKVQFICYTKWIDQNI